MHPSRSKLKLGWSQGLRNNPRRDLGFRKVLQNWEASARMQSVLWGWLAGLLNLLTAKGFYFLPPSILSSLVIRGRGNVKWWLRDLVWEPRLFEFESLLVWSLANHLTLCFRFLTWKMETVTVVLASVWYENWMGCYIESADDSSCHPGNAKEMLVSNFKDLWEWQNTGPSCK